MALETSQVMNKRYRIVKLLGRGGFGAVYQAWDLNLSRPCALKENIDTSKEAQRQFAREATVLANLNHPNLPKVYEHFFDPERGQYLVMDYIEGEDLDSHINNKGKIPFEQAIQWLEQIIESLIFLHTQQPPIIHRDLKPANIRITPQGKVFLVDFGLVKVYDPKLKTTIGARGVTPGFAPPEQYGGGNTDARSDLYALAATLYTMLSGEYPPESIQRIATEALPQLPLLEKQLSSGITQAISCAMSLNPSQRFASVEAFRDVLTSEVTRLNIAPKNEQYNNDQNKTQAIEAIQSLKEEPKDQEAQLPESEEPETLRISREDVKKKIEAHEDFTAKDVPHLNQQDGSINAKAHLEEKEQPSKAQKESDSKEKKPKQKKPIKGSSFLLWGFLSGAAMLVLAATIGISLLYLFVIRPYFVHPPTQQVTTTNPTAAIVVNQAPHSTPRLSSTISPLTPKNSPTALEPTLAPSPQAIIVFGPQRGSLKHEPEDKQFEDYTPSNIKLRDFTVEAVFSNPNQDGDWDYGFIFLNAESDQYRFVAFSDKTWQVKRYDFSVEPFDSTIITEGTAESLKLGDGSQNELRLQCKGAEGNIWINGDFIANFPIAEDAQAGSIGVGTGFFSEDETEGAATHYQDFIISIIP